MGHLLAIDAGTGSVRAVLFDEQFRQVGIAAREYHHATLPEHPGSQVFDTAGNWRAACECVREALARAGVAPGDVAAVSTTSMREGMVLYDGEGRELWACPNADSRAAAESRQLVASGLADRIYETAGDWVAITAPPRLLWLAAHEPAVLERARHLTMLGDWVLYRLCGEFVTDPSLGSSSALFDLAKRSWSPELVEAVGLDPAVLPPVEEPGTLVGRVTPKAAEETGLAAGTPVVVGGADTQLALLGLGLTEPVATTVIGGSFWQTTRLLDTPLIDPDKRLRTLCHAVPGRWMIEGIGFWCGIVMRWFRDAFCAEEKRAAAARGTSAYALMEELAAAVPPGAHGVLGIFSNVMDAKRWIHASPALVQFDVAQPERAGKAECVRAIEESAAYASLGHLQIIEELTAATAGSVVFTGGAAQGRLWPRILAAVLGRSVQLPTVRESTALGAAVCAAAGVGLLDGVTQAQEALPGMEATIHPDPDEQRAYRQLYPRWRAAYARMLDLVEDGLLQPMWRAADVTTRAAGQAAAGMA